MDGFFTVTDRECAKEFMEAVEKRYPLLTREEELELGARAKQGDEEAKERLLGYGLRVMAPQAMRYAGRGVLMTDLLQEGTLAVVKAMERFLESEETRFTAKLSWWIRQALTGAVADAQRSPGIPVRLIGWIESFRKARKEAIMNGETLTEEETALAAGIPAEHVEEVLSALKETRVFPAPIPEPEPEPEYEPLLTKEDLPELIAGLTEREQKVLNMRFGLQTGEPRTMEQTGQELGVTRERVRQIEAKARRKLNRLFREKEAELRKEKTASIMEEKRPEEGQHMQSIKEFVAANRDALIRDIGRLVAINSVKTAPEEGAPYGPGVRKVELETMKIAEELGFEEVRDCDGYIAYAHTGPEDRFLGIIGHTDIVPVTDGWFRDPFEMFEKDGFLLGRGTGDDKGPLLAAMYACKYLMENRIPLRYGLRVLIGCDEECGMSDVPYYLEHCQAPVFAFTPDAGFPVGHGEKGIYSTDLISAPVADRIVFLSGGTATNVVPDKCIVTLKDVSAEVLREAAKGSDRYEISEKDGLVTVTAKGVAAHAGMPFESVNANGLIADLLLKADVLEGAEKHAVTFMSKVMENVYGTFEGIDGEDGRFAPTTLICGMVKKLEDGSFLVNVNSRYNTSVTPKQVEDRVAAKAAEWGFRAENTDNSGPFYLEPDHPAVQLMCDIYNEVTGENEKPFVISGGTYARHMANTVSFGCEMPNEKTPDWVGSAHMTNEAISIDTLLKALEIYIETLIRLQSVDFD
jgi:succinyl-diaminopimelate desuccinylase